MEGSGEPRSSSLKNEGGTAQHDTPDVCNGEVDGESHTTNITAKDEEINNRNTNKEVDGEDCQEKGGGSSPSTPTLSSSSLFALLGTGNSTGVPWLSCIINPTTRCSICQNCLDDPQSKNIRNNPAALIRYAHPDGRTRNILIDCGKTFRDCVLKSFRTFGVEKIDAILITHAHADAYLVLSFLNTVIMTN